MSDGWGAIASYRGTDRVDLRMLNADELASSARELAGGERRHVLAAPKASLGDDVWHVVFAVGVSESHAADTASALRLPPEVSHDLSLATARARVDIFDEYVLFAARTVRTVAGIDHSNVPDLRCVLAHDVLLVVAGTDSHGIAIDAVENFVPTHVQHGTLGVQLRLLSSVAQQYSQIVEDLEDQVTALELEVFASDAQAPTHIYQLGRKILAFVQIVEPLAQSFDDWEDDISSSPVGSGAQLAATHVQRKLLRATERAQGLRALLSEAMDVNAALIGQRQNEAMKKISAWAAIIVIPTLVSGIYGMNFRHMPELSWVAGYPFALAVMVAASAAMYVVFRRKKWL